MAKTMERGELDEKRRELDEVGVGSNRGVVAALGHPSPEPAETPVVTQRRPSHSSLQRPANCLFLVEPGLLSSSARTAQRFRNFKLESRTEDI